jgi:TonB family protein
MWDETLIESKGKRNNGKRWLTVQIAAIVHAGALAILIAGSFWYADGMTLPVQSQTITSVFISEGLPNPPAQIGIRRQSSVEKPVANNSKPVETLTQEKLVPEDSNFVESSTPISDLNSLGGLPVGDPDGVNGGLPNGTGNGGFGSGGNGIGTGEPIPQDQFTTLRIQQPEVLRRVEPLYPSTLLRMHKEGVVVLQALITANGDVQKIEILRSDHALFAKSAIDAVSQWKYRPARLNGKPVAVYFQVTVVFKIR